MMYPGLKPRAEFHRPCGTYPVLVFPEQFMEHTGNLRDNCVSENKKYLKESFFCLKFDFFKVYFQGVFFLENGKKRRKR